MKKFYSTLGMLLMSLSIFSQTNMAPSFTSTPVTSINEGATYTYNVTTKDADGDEVSVTATTLPSWLSFNSGAVVSTLAGSGVSGFTDGTANSAQFNAPFGVAVDASGNVYVADTRNHRIRKITPAGLVSTLAGSGIEGFDDGAGESAQFNNPSGVAVDASGNVYVADSRNHRIRKITPTGVVSTFAGSTRGYADGTGESAQFNQPTGVAVDASGTVYVADLDNQRIRKITSAREVSTLAGGRFADFADGTGTAARFSFPFDVAVDVSGNVYVGDQGNHRIRKITPAGVVSTLAGSAQGFSDGIGSTAQFNSPRGVATDAAGNVYVADLSNHRIRQITPAGEVSTLAGSGAPGFEDGTVTTAQFNAPFGVAVDASGTVYVADFSNQRIRLIIQNPSLTGTPASAEVGDHQVVLEASDGNGGVVNQSFMITVNDITPPVFENSTPGSSSITEFGFTLAVDLDETGTAYYVVLADGATAPTAAEVKAGTASGGATAIISGNAVVSSADFTTNVSVTGLSGKTLYKVYVVAEDALGNLQTTPSTIGVTTLNTPPTFTSTPVTSINEGATYSYSPTTTDADGDEVSVTATTLPSWLSFNSGAVVSTLAGSGVSGFTDGTANSAQFNAPFGVAVDASGNVYVADTRNHRIRKITPAGLVSTLAGSGIEGFDDGAGESAQFNNPSGVAVDASGNVYVADSRNHRIRKITPTGVVSTFAGSTRGYADGTGESAQFNQPTGVAVDASGTVYVADLDNQRIRKITSAREVSTLAGGRFADFADGTGTAARFSFPFDVAVDVSGNVYVGDQGNHRIRKITPAGVVSTLAGSAQGFSDGIGSTAQFNSPRGVTTDAAGNVYVADLSNHRIRQITPAGEVSTLAGSGAPGFEDGTVTTAQFSAPFGVAVDASGTVYVADFNNQRIRLIEQNTSLTGTPTGTEVGDYEVVLQASDGNGGVVNQSFTITVNDVTPPAITSVSIPANATYVAGQNLDFTVNFNENVTVDTASGSPQLDITIGTIARQAIYQSGSGTGALVFRYTVQVGDFDTDGIAVGTLAANGGTLRDAAGNDADLTLNNVGVTTGVLVDARVPSAPTTANTTQIYAGTATISDLQATGTDIKWYDAATGGNLLSNSDNVVDGTTYYASQTIDGVESTERLAVTTKKISEAEQTFLSSNNPTVADLVTTPTTGATAQWYATATGGTELATTDILATGTYYVEQQTPESIETFLTNTLVGIPDVGVLSDGRIVLSTTDIGSEIYIYNADGTNQLVLSSSFADPSSLVVLPGDKILVADGASIKRMDADGSNIITLATGFSTISDMAIQSDGKILIIDRDTGELKRMDADGSNITILATGFDGARSVAVEADGKILIADLRNSEVKRMDADGSNIVTLASGFNLLFSLAVKPNGQIYIGDSNRLMRMDADGSNLVSIGGGFRDLITSIAIQPDGKVLAAQFDLAPIIRLTEASTSNRVAVDVVINTTPTITFNDISKTYGEASFDLEATSNSTGEVTYSIVAGGTGTASLSGTTNQTVTLGNAGTVTLKASVAETANFEAAEKEVTLTIAQRAISLTAQTQSKVYGIALTLDNTAFTVTDLDGDSVLPNGELIDAVSMSSAAGVDANTLAVAATYPNDLVISSPTGSNGFSVENYSLTYVAGDFIVNPRPITITAQAQSKVYGTVLTLDNTAFTVTDLDTDSILPNGELIDVVSLSSATGVDASTTADTGTYTDELIISSPTGSNGFSVENYSLTYVSGDLVVTPAEQTGLVFADNSFTYDGLVKSLVVTGQASDATVTYTDNDQIDAGTYAVTATVARPNYTTAVLNATLSINKAEAIITANAVQTFTYDGTQKSISADLNHTETTLTYSPQQGYTDAGSYPITVSAAETANYLAASENVSLVIEPATQTGLVFADNSFTYDGSVKSLEVTGQASDATVTYTDNDQIDAGTYAVTATVARPNYTTAVLNATLTITKAEAIITADAVQTFTYDGTVKTINAGLNHNETTLTYSPQQTYTDAGTYSVAVEAEETSNYLAATESVQLVINKAEQSITFGALETRSLEEDPDFQLDASASSELEISYAYAYSSAEPAATVTASGFVELLTSGQIIITASQAGNANYEAATSIEQALTITSSNAEATSITINGEIFNNPAEEIYYFLDCENATSFVDVVVSAEANSQVSPGLNFSIDTPVPGIYSQEVVVTSQEGLHTRTYMVVVEKAFDFNAIIVQKYNNALVVNNNPETNGGYSFVSYKWYKNGELVSDQQSFSEGNRSSDVLDPNATYQAVMVTSSGDELRTCISSAKFYRAQELSLHQNPVNQGDALRAIAQFPEDELKNAIFQVYDLNGRLLVTVPVSGVENTIYLPANIASGLYKLILITSQRQENVSFIRK